MLNKDNMRLKISARCEDIDLFNSGNGQFIREALLRQACMSCEHYATDIIILLQGSDIKNMFSGTIDEIDIYFESSNIEWVTWSSGKEVPKLYRKAMKLFYNGHTVYLYETSGNC